MAATQPAPSANATPSAAARARATAARWVEAYLSRGFDPRVTCAPRR